MKIYGSNTYVAVDANSEVAAGSVSAMQNLALDWLSLEPYISYDIEDYETPIGYNFSKNSRRQTYRIELYGYNVNDVTDYNNFKLLQNILSKKFLYLDASDYYHSVHTAGNVIGVQLSDSPSISCTPPYIDVEFSLMKMKF